jgi:phosphomannomutase
MATVETLADRAARWIADDPDPATRAELEALVEAGDWDELTARFAGPLTFGTAGLRAPLGAGPARINRATVRQTTAGLAAYLLATVPGAAEAGVVVGRDARHSSAELAEEAARVLAGAGFVVTLIEGARPTPVLAFNVRRLDAAAGVMVTASHNPKADNGYKVYWSDGVQIVPPHDEGIAAAAAAVGPLAAIPRSDRFARIGTEAVNSYLDAIVPAALHTDARDVRIVYTPVHGVGRDVAMEAFERAGFPAPSVVAEQADPDPDFPTAPRPNPEEPGVLDLAVALATSQAADVVIANDPDADRLGAAIPDGRGGWRTLAGDEIGAILADHLLRHTAEVADRILVTTVASSTLLGRMAEGAGTGYAETLTGFKWIMRAAVGTGRRLLLGYEEALGFAVTDLVADKDGISAALALAEAAAEAKRDGSDLDGRLADVAVRFGLHATEPRTIDLEPRPGAAASMMAAARAGAPAALAGRAVTVVDDLATGVRRPADGPPETLRFPRSDVLVWRADDGTRVVIRPSGTEPRIKLYLQVVVPVPSRADLPAARQEAAAHLAILADEVTASIGS